MSKIFNKLNLGQQSEILVLEAPKSFEPEIEKLDHVTIKRDLKDFDVIDFVLVFVKDKADLTQFARAVTPKIRGDAIVWFAYPKMSSKKYDSDINRDTGWEILDEMGFKPVRQVAIDQDWSALRFRRVSFIGT